MFVSETLVLNGTNIIPIYCPIVCKQKYQNNETFFTTKNMITENAVKVLYSSFSL